MRCQCPQCSPTPSPTWTREHALLCEARMLASLPLTVRRDYLASPMVQARRQTLEHLLLDLWRSKHEDTSPRSPAG